MAASVRTPQTPTDGKAQGQTTAPSPLMRGGHRRVKTTAQVYAEKMAEPPDAPWRQWAAAGAPLVEATRTVLRQYRLAAGLSQDRLAEEIARHASPDGFGYGFVGTSVSRTELSNARMAALDYRLLLLWLHLTGHTLEDLGRDLAPATPATARTPAVLKALADANQADSLEALIVDQFRRLSGQARALAVAVITSVADTQNGVTVPSPSPLALPVARPLRHQTEPAPRQSRRAVEIGVAAEGAMAEVRDAARRPRPSRPRQSA